MPWKNVVFASRTNDEDLFEVIVQLMHYRIHSNHDDFDD